MHHTSALCSHVSLSMSNGFFANSMLVDGFFLISFVRHRQTRFSAFKCEWHLCILHIARCRRWYPMLPPTPTATTDRTNVKFVQLSRAPTETDTVLHFKWFQFAEQTLDRRKYRCISNARTHTNTHQHSDIGDCVGQDTLFVCVF